MTIASASDASKPLVPQCGRPGDGLERRASPLIAGWPPPAVALCPDGTAMCGSFHFTFLKSPGMDHQRACRLSRVAAMSLILTHRDPYTLLCRERAFYLTLPPTPLKPMSVNAL